MKTGVIIQARLGSTRLPNKTLLHIWGKPMLQHVIERASRINRVDRVIVACPIQDKPLASLAKSLGIQVYKHDHTLDKRKPSESYNNVLERFYGAAKAFELDNIIRITSDCPLLDPEVSSKVVDAYFKYRGAYQYVTNRTPQTWPDGLDTEIFSFRALTTARREATDSYDLQHVTPFMYKPSSPMRWLNVPSPVDLSHYKWSVDTYSDIERVRQIIACSGEDVGYKECLEWEHQRPVNFPTDENAQWYLAT